MSARADQPPIKFPPRPQSQAAYERASRVIVGGVNSPARAFGAVGGQPLFIERGQGAYLCDIDGHRYIDYCCSWGPLILGHAHPRVVAAVEEALHRGTSFGAPTEAETELAELIVEAVPSIEKVRLVNSGTEATMSAIRLARGYTGRDLVIKFAGCYHGHVDSLLVHAGSSATTLGVPFSPGVPAGCAKDTLSLPYNDADQVADVFKKRGDQIATVIVEPVAGNMGVVLPRKGFLEALRDLTARHGALLIFDEVITGFRLAYGGAQERFGHTPDLTTLGKIIGGGLPVGAYGGRADIMAKMLPEGPVFQAGTLSGNPIAVAAGLATLKELKENPPYDRLEQMGARLARGLHEAAHDAGVPHTVGHIGSMTALFFAPTELGDKGSDSEPRAQASGLAGGRSGSSDQGPGPFSRDSSSRGQQGGPTPNPPPPNPNPEPRTSTLNPRPSTLDPRPWAVTDYDSARRCDTAAFARFFWAMLDRGIYLPCSQFEAWFISAAHTDADLDATLAAARAALAAIA